MKKIDSTKRYERLRERMGNGDIDRRSFLGLLRRRRHHRRPSGGIMATMATQACAAGTEVRYFDGWGGVVSEALRKYAFEPYTPRPASSVVDGTFGDENEVLTKVKAAAARATTTSCIRSGVKLVQALGRCRLCGGINEANIPNMANVMPAMIEPFRKITPDSCRRCPTTTAPPASPTTPSTSPRRRPRSKGANLLIDPKYKGKIGG